MSLRERRLRRLERRKQGVTPYDLFIVAITLLSFVNIVLYFFIKNETLLLTLGIIDVVLSLLFLIDFLRLLYNAENRFHYFFKDFGWADFLASYPYPLLKLFRIFRLVKSSKAISEAGFKGIKQGYSKNVASAALLVVLFIIILLLEFGSVGILILESRNPDANIKTASDAIWWVYVTIATVGYGDRYPVTNDGRLFATFVMLVGVGLFGVVTGFLANKFLPSSSKSSDNADASKDEVVADMQKELQEIRKLLISQQKPKTSKSKKA